MADQRQITLRSGHATPAAIIMRALPVASVSTLTIYLYPFHATQKTILLRDPLTRDAPDVTPPATGGYILRTMMGLG